MKFSNFETFLVQNYTSFQWIFGDGTVNGSPKRFFPAYLKNSTKQKLKPSTYKKSKHQ